MIRYALVCDKAHEFEAWFASSDAYDEQAKGGLVECPMCGTRKVRKQIMSPAISTSGRSRGEAEPRPAAAPREGSGGGDECGGGEGGAADAPAEAPRPGLSADLEALAAKVRAHIKQTHVYVGDKFAEEARAMHEGTKDEAPIYGEATAAQARRLREEGVPVAALPEIFAPIPPKKTN